jgi:hypothetical protein
MPLARLGLMAKVMKTSASLPFVISLRPVSGSIFDRAG